MRRRLARWISPPAPRGDQRMYHAAKVSRLTAGWVAGETSADAELHSSLRNLRSRSRQLVRDAGYAKRAKVVVVNNVIGPGVGFQGAVSNRNGRLMDEVNDPIEREIEHWSRAENCHTGGRLHLADFERQAMGQVFEAGECVVRLHLRAFGASRVPLALEIIESERIADNFNQAPGPQANRVRMGVEVDEFDRPLAYWLRPGHPGDLHGTRANTERLLRVPADQILHLYVVDRWPQTRGEPWLHAAARKLNDLDGYSEAEIIAARNAACYMGFITSPDPDTPLTDERNATTGEAVTEMAPGLIQRLNPGENFASYTPTRPNAAFDGFLRAVLREIAGAVGTSYESLSRDYSQSNYSSSRLALLDDRDLWRVLQSWWIRAFRAPLHRLWMRQAVYARAVPVPIDEYVANPEKFEAARFKPRGWSWVDPTKEVAAYKEAVKAGFCTVADVIAATNGGQDLEDVLKARRQELDLMADLDLQFDTDPALEQQITAPAAPAAAAETGNDGEDATDTTTTSGEPGDEPARVYALRG
jgi:lambda family phage portal protein